jgi:hypothetical protein
MTMAITPIHVSGAEGLPFNGVEIETEGLGSDTVRIYGQRIHTGTAMTTKSIIAHMENKARFEAGYDLKLKVVQIETKRGRLERMKVAT